MLDTADPNARIRRFLDRYHQVTLAFGSALLALGWSRIFNLTSKDNFERSIILVALISCGYLVFLSLQFPQSNDRRYRQIVAWLWLGICGYYLSLNVWNTQFLLHAVTTGYRGDIFRNAFQTFQSPLYGVARPIAGAGTVWVTAYTIVYVGVIYAVTRFRSTSIWRDAVILALLYMTGVLIFAIAEAGNRVFDPTKIFVGFSDSSNLDYFRSPMEVWSSWNENLGQLQGRADHYPPAVMFMAALERDLALPGLLAAMSAVLSIFCVPLVAVLGLMLELPRQQIVCAAALMIASAGMLIFPVSKFEPLMVFLTLVCLVGIVAALKGRVGFCLLSGAALAMHGLLSFTAIIAGTLCAVITVLAYAMQIIDGRAALKMALITSLSAAAVWGFVYLATGFDILTCLQLSFSNNKASMTTETIGNVPRYLLRSSGNVLAYIAYLGPLTALLAGVGIASARNVNARFGAFALGTALTVLMTGFSTLFFLETERIWIFFFSCRGAHRGLWCWTSRPETST